MINRRVKPQNSSAPSAPIWHNRDTQSVLELLNSGRDAGLTSDVASLRLVQEGPNRLTEASADPWWKRLAAQFRDLVVWILIVAAVIAGIMAEWPDALAILAIIVINGIIGFLQEERAERALSSLRKMSAPMAKAVRDGGVKLIPASDIVRGDVLELEAGDNIPADARILSASSLRVQEASLTGESTAVDKDPVESLADDCALGDRRNMVYMGTTVAAGKGRVVTVATGMQTELGRIAGLLQRQVRELTPLQKRLAELGRVLVVICLSIVAVIFFLQLARGGKPFETLLISVSLAVAAVPEGLPAVVTLTLALGLRRMVQRNALVRKLPSVETLGSVTTVCSDKTGTLTRNEMTVREIVTADAHFEVTGTGYEPRGEFTVRTEARVGEDFCEQHLPEATDLQERRPHLKSTAEPKRSDAPLALLTTAAYCNNAQVVPRTESSMAWQVIGDPTEGALIIAAMKAGVQAHEQRQRVVLAIPFDSDRRSMSVVVRDDSLTREELGSQPSSAEQLHVKGAPEVVLGKSSHELCDGQFVGLTDSRREQIRQTARDMASRALRVLAFARRDVDLKKTRATADELETDLVFLGLSGMIDPPRDEAREAVRRCRAAGIRPVMITGDHPDTAMAIARELGIAQPDDDVLTGIELDRLAFSELADRTNRVSVFARVSAEHKLKIVEAFKSRGHVVAMTGDGVNDAPAVRAADIGIAMGITGTDVTKEASDMVLVDDNFASIVNAVEEGRGIFDNIQKFVHFLLASNASEVLLMLFAALLGWPVPLMAIQILWINLVSDGFAALALGLELPERDIMQRPPRPSGESVVTRGRGLLILLHGSLLATVAAIGFQYVYQDSVDHLARARTVAFGIVAFSQLFFAVACRSQRFTMPELGFFTNPLLFAAIAVSGLLQLSIMTLPFAQPVFEVATHLTWEWGLILLLSLIPVTVVECWKLVRPR